MQDCGAAAWSARRGAGITGTCVDGTCGARSHTPRAPQHARRAIASLRISATRWWSRSRFIACDSKVDFSSCERERLSVFNLGVDSARANARRSPPSTPLCQPPRSSRERVRVKRCSDAAACACCQARRPAVAVFAPPPATAALHWRGARPPQPQRQKLRNPLHAARTEGEAQCVVRQTARARAHPRSRCASSRYMNLSTS